MAAAAPAGSAISPELGGAINVSMAPTHAGSPEPVLSFTPAIGGVGGAATPLLGGVLGKMGSAELDLLVGSIEKNAGALKAKKAVKAVPALKRNPTMSKRAEAFVEKVRQLLKTNAG